MTWLGCTKQYKKYYKQQHIQNKYKFLPWYMYCSEHYNVFEYLVRTGHEIKKVGGILGKSAPKKGKTITNEILHLVTSVNDDSFNK